MAIPGFKFVETWKFREAAIYFEKHGCYDDGGVEGTLIYDQYWTEQERRCLEGYTANIGGYDVRISGYHYFYLNFCPIEQVVAVQKGKDKTTRTAAKRITNFPKFWDLDWIYFTALDIAEYGLPGDTYEEQVAYYENLPLELDLVLDEDNITGGKHLLWLKFRGCGASWKGASMPARNWFLIRESKSFMFADNEQYLDKDGVWTKFMKYKNFINLHTPFTKYTDVKSSEGDLQIRASHRDLQGNEKGYLSEVIGVKVGGKPDKAHPYSQKVLTTRGLLNWGDLVVGDEVYNEKSIPVKVEELHEFGELDIYDIRFSDGRVVKASLNHEWEVEKWKTVSIKNKSVRKKETSIVTTKDLIKFTNYSSYSASKCSIPIAPSLELPSIPVEYNAYTLGVMLGDGSINKSTSSKSYLTMKWEDVDAIKKYIPYNVEKATYGGDIRNIIHIPNGREMLIELGLFNKVAGDKFIPDLYKYNSRQVRLDVINGLLDTDGSVTKDFGVIEYSTKSSQLADDFVWVVRSLGYGAKKGSKIINGVTYYRCYIYCKPDALELFNLPRKKDLVKTKKFSKKGLHFSSVITIESVTYSHKEKARCITTSESTPKKSGKYLIGDFVTTLNCRGKRGKVILFEEFGTFNKGGDVYSVTRSSLEELNLVFGTAVLYGTAGIDGKAFETMEKMFYSPKAFGLLRFNNTLDDDLIGTECALFTPADYNVANVDSEGNSDRETNRVFIMKERAVIAKSSDANDAAKAKMEHPLRPGEALLRSNDSILPKAELLAWKTELVASHQARTAVYGFFEGDTFKPSPDARPVITFPHKKTDVITGCVTVWQSPYKKDGYVPDNLYIVCVDPYMHDSSQGDSLGAAYVIKNINNFSKPDDQIVASFVGRPKTMDEFHRNVEKLARMYNAKIGYENNAGQGLLSYFKSKNLLSMLAKEFELGYNENIPKSTVKRGFGMHIDGYRKKLGISYLADWLTKPWMTDENEVQLYNYHKIYDLGLLEELIKFSEDRNVDRVSAMIIAMFHMKEIEHKLKGPVSDKRKKGIDPFFKTILYKE
jgi:hypothetical protein